MSVNLESEPWMPATPFAKRREAFGTLRPHNDQGFRWLGIEACPAKARPLFDYGTCGIRRRALSVERRICAKYSR